ncbi:hypothetical protein LAZ67_14001278, partial [Cordylochernes scorpioides]
MTEDSNMQRMTEAGDEYFADALTNMQPHCEDLVSRLTDAIRGIAVPRVEEALISSFDGSYAASNFIQQLERTSEGPQDDATLQTRLRTLLKGEPLSLYNELNLASLPYSQAKQTLIDLYPGKSEVTFTKFLTFKLTNQIQLGEYYRQKITMGLQLGLTNPIIVEALTEGLQASDQRLMRAIAPKTLTEWYSTMTRIKGTSSLPTPSEPFQGVSNTSAFHRDTGTSSRGRNYNPFSTNNTPRYPSGARRPTSPCKYCQGDHWNNECPMNRRPYRQQAYHGQPTAHYFPPEQNGAHNLPGMGKRKASPKINSSINKTDLKENSNMEYYPKDMIPSFNPEEGLKYSQWLKVFNQQIKLRNIKQEDALFMIPTLFKGNALEIYATICDEIDTLEDLHSRMMTFFPEFERGLHKKFWQLTKQETQSVRGYYFEKVKIGTQLHMPKDLVLESLTSGAGPLEKFLIASSPQSLEDWLRIAESLEHTTQQRDGRWNNGRRNNFAGGNRPNMASRWRSITQQHGDVNAGQLHEPGHPGTSSIGLQSKTINQSNIYFPSCFKSRPIYQPNFRPLPLPNSEDSYIHNDVRLGNNFHVLMNDYDDIFGENKYNVRPLKVDPPRLTLRDKTPVCLRPYRHNLKDNGTIKEQISQLLKYGIIKPASSPYSSPVTLARKKGESDKTRLCIDFRKLNSKLMGDSFPIPLIEDIIQKVQGSRVFSCLDILSAYWTVSLHEKDQYMTCFTTTEGSYQWCRLPFGLRTAPAIFNRILSSILQKYDLKNVISYFDDILVFSNDTQSHLEHLKEIFEILQKEGIQLRKEKCLFFMKKINYLGYEIFGDQMSPSGINVDIIKSLPPPRNVRCLRSFLGSVTHYAKFINHFNKLRAPLNNLLKKDIKFTWTDECQKSFEALKEALVSKPILQIYNPLLTTHIFCDASTAGLGGVLKQEYPDGTMRPIAFYSRALRGAESKYTITELELLAIIETCKRYHPYLSGQRVIVHTDHQALIWLNNFKHTNGRLFRWSLRLSEYDLEFKYNKGCENYEADMLSRLPYSCFLSIQDLKEGQESLAKPSSKLYFNKDNITYIRLKNKDRIVVPPSLQQELIIKAHESLGHPGISAMARVISTQYYFKGMIGKIKNYILKCRTCQSVKKPTTPSYGLMGTLPLAEKPFDVVALDSILGLGEYNSTKNCLHVVVDHHSRYIWAFPSKSTSIATYINIINQLLSIGKPKIIVTDRHPSFVSKRFNKFIQEKGVKHVMTSPSHPQCNGLVERANATIISKLRLHHQQNPRIPWHKLLQKALEEYRNTPHSITTIPPVYLLFGINPFYTSDLTIAYPPIEEARKTANDNTKKLHLKLVKRYNESHKTPNLKIGDKVLYKIPYQSGQGKLMPAFYPEPYTIIAIPSPQTIEIDKPCQPENKRTTIVNISKIRLWEPGMGKRKASPKINSSINKTDLKENSNMEYYPKDMIPSFNPEEGLKYSQWLKVFNQQIKLRNIKQEDALFMIPTLFKGNALEIYATICDEIDTLEDLHSRMMTFFPEFERGLHKKFWQLTKQETQSVRGYYFEKVKIGTQLHMPKDLVLESLTSGAGPLEKFLIASSPQSLEDWLRIAESLEHTTQQRDGRWNNGRRNNFAGGNRPNMASRWRSITQQHGDVNAGQLHEPGHPGTSSIGLQSKTINQSNIYFPSCFKSRPIYQPNFRPLPLPNSEDSYIHNDVRLGNNFHVLMNDYDDIFGENKYNVRPLKVDPPRLTLRDKTPVCLRPYRHNLKDNGTIKEQISQLLKYGIIKPASSPYSSPVTLARKKGESDKTRLCIDFRKLNSKLMGDSFPIPLIEDIIQKVQGSRVFSCLDILSAYWTVSLHEKDQYMTCFTTTEGSYQWCRLPFGLRTAPAIFNRILSSILQKYDLKNVISYFDDILVFSNDTQSHLEHLKEIFEILQKEGIQLRKEKCLFFMKKINYLGYEIFGDQMSPSGINVDIIKSLPPPRNVRCLRSFLGSVTHYAKFINHFNKLRAPLNNLLKKDIKFTWTDECQKSFEALKEALVSKPILQIYNPLLTTHIFCDASTAGLGGVLKQEYPDGTMRPIAFYSRALRGAESKYTITELELLAIIETCKRYHPYLSGQRVIVHTDHQALIWLNNFKHTNGRLFRWSLRLSEYDLEFKYNKGCENYEADMLSRLPYSCFLSIQDLKEGQESLAKPSSKLYFNKDNITYIRLKNKDRIVVPPSLQQELIIKAHESLGHPGISAMARVISTQYYFKGMIGKIKKYILKCRTCQSVKKPTTPSYGLMGTLPLAEKPFDVVALDSILGLGEYNSTKNCLHVVVDHHSRYIWAFPSKSTSIATYINIINQLLSIGKPKIIVTDRHPSFVSKRFNKFIQEKGVKHVMTSPSHPQCNGLVERANATIISKLRLHHQQNPRIPWHKLLQKALEEYRNTPHSITTIPPVYLLFGINPFYTSDLTIAYPPIEEARKTANDNTKKLHLKLVKRYNESHKTPNLKIGDKVLYKIPYQSGQGKLMPAFYPEPYTIIAIPSPQTIEIDKPCQPENKRTTIVNISKIRLWEP